MFLPPFFVECHPGDGDAGLFLYNEAQRRHDLVSAPKAATRFLFELIARLQELGTVAMIDVRAYAKHIP
jgi:hypothetical protein